MSLPDALFKYVPELRGKLVEPEQSRLRLSLDDFKQIDANARAEGRPEGWRMSHEEREANRAATLAGRLDRDLWVLGYGSLMWDPSIRISELRRAHLPGWRRRFCLNQPFGRGTAETPGLMLAIDRCGADIDCEGIAMLIPSDRVDTESTFLWRREMMTGAYLAEFLHMQTPQGPVEALTFCVNRKHSRYLELPEEEAARRIARAEGPIGRNIDYLENLVVDLDSLSIRDPVTRDLLGRARADLAD